MRHMETTTCSDLPTTTVSLVTGDLVVGDIVLAHGLRCLVTDAPTLSRSHPGERTFFTSALVLNRDDVDADQVPFSFTSTESYPSRGMAPRPAGEHRWTIQGNDLALFTVERAAGAS